MQIVWKNCTQENNSRQGTNVRRQSKIKIKSERSRNSKSKTENKDKCCVKIKIINNIIIFWIRKKHQ